MCEKWVTRLNIFVIAFLVAAVCSTQIVWVMKLAFLHGADTACATTKECPSGFEAKWVEAGCLCVPSSKARR